MSLLKQKIVIIVQVMRRRGLTALMRLLAEIALWRLALITESLYIFISRHKERVVQVYGYKMVVDLADKGASRDIYYHHVREKESSDLFLNQLVQDGRDVLDIGANIGYYAIMEASTCPSRTVYALEPEPDCFRLLQKGARLNKADNMVCFNVAAGDRNGVLRFAPARSLNLSRAASRDDRDYIIVPVTTVDDFLQGRSIGFLRMDVEGYEVAILRGARKTIKNTSKLKLFIEFHPAKMLDYGDSLDDMCELLSGFRLDYVASFSSPLPYLGKRPVVKGVLVPTGGSTISGRLLRKLAPGGGRVFLSRN